jgi:hypothetical protein
VLTAGIAHSRTADGSTKEIEYYPGDTKNLRYPKGEGMTHDLENVGTKDLLFITVEFLDSENSPLPLPSVGSSINGSFPERSRRQSFINVFAPR